MKMRLLFLTCISCNLFPMREDHNPKQVQEIYEALGTTKKLSECETLLKTARKQDDVAYRMRIPHALPIYAPWREDYKKQEQPQPQKAASKKCPFCDQFSRPEDDKNNFILERGKHSVVMFNRNPYLPLHFLLIPYRHVAKLEDLSDQERLELLQRTVSWFKKLRKLHIGGANIFFNLESKCAGASIPEHLHSQLLSRWTGDDSTITHLIARDIVQGERRHLLSNFYKPRNMANLARVFEPYSRLLASMKPPTEEDPRPCYMCEAVQNKTQDNENFVIKRFKHWILILDRFGYDIGHLFLSSTSHATSLPQLNQPELDDLNQALTLSQKTLKENSPLDGLNISVNEGTCAGKRFDGHVCYDIVPRTVNDTSTTAVLCGRPVIERNLETLRLKLIAALSKPN